MGKFRVSDIEGIGPFYEEKLRAINIRSVKSLRERGATRKGRKEIAESAGIDGKLILRWVNAADLYRVRGVGSEYSELLEKAGVDTVKELRNRNPENLHAKMVEVNDASKLVRKVPSLSMVKSWVEFAKTLEPMITY